MFSKTYISDLIIKRFKVNICVRQYAVLTDFEEKGEAKKRVKKSNKLVKGEVTLSCL